MSSLQNALTVRANCSHRRESDRLVQDELKVISVQIGDAKLDRRNDIVHKLPMHFGIKNLNDEKARIYIHGKMLKHLLDKGYDVKISKINPDDERVKSGSLSEGYYMKISWKDEFEELELKDLEDLLQSYTIQTKSRW